MRQIGRPAAGVPRGEERERHQHEHVSVGDGEDGEAGRLHEDRRRECKALGYDIPKHPEGDPAPEAKQPNEPEVERAPRRD